MREVIPGAGPPWEDAEVTDTTGRSGLLAGDEVRLTLPSEPEYGRLARIAAAALALRAGFDYPEIEDLRIALDEALILLLRPEGSPGVVTVVFRLGTEDLDIVATTTAGDDQHWVDAGARARFDRIVGGIVDVAEVDDAGRRVHLVVRQR